MKRNVRVPCNSGTFFVIILPLLPIITVVVVIITLPIRICSVCILRWHNTRRACGGSGRNRARTALTRAAGSGGRRIATKIIRVYGTDNMCPVVPSAVQSGLV